MKNTIISLFLILLVSCSLLGLSLLFTDREVPEEKEVSEETSGDEEEEPIELSSVKFKKLKKCTAESAEEYTEFNDLLVLYSVTFGFEKIRMYVQISDVDQSFTDLQLVFNVGSETEVYTVKTVFPGSNYEILIPRHGATEFQLVDAKWSNNEKHCESKEFGFPIVLRGTNTLKTFASKSILVADDFGNIINEIDTKFGGTYVLNQGASYYLEVID